LRELEVCFCRLDIGDRMDSSIVHNSVRVRKVEIDYINDPKAPGHEVEFQRKWVDVLWGRISPVRVRVAIFSIVH
jgi:hypothetical protein